MAELQLPEAQPAASTSSRESERQAILSVLQADRKLVVLGGWMIAALALALLGIGLLRHPVLDAQSVAWCSATAVIVLMALWLQLAPRHQLYNIIFVWVVVIDLIIVGQLTNFYFGVERALILSGTIPVLMLGVLVVVVAARAMLVARDANQLNLSVLALLSLMTTIHALLYWDEAETHYAMLLMMATVMIAGPLCELLMRHHFRVQSRAERALRAALADARFQANEAQRQGLTDALTGLLNRRGILESVDAALAEHPMTGIARIAMANPAALRKHLGEEALQGLIRQLAEALATQAMPDARLGHRGDGEFDLWGPWKQGEEAWDQHCREIAVKAQDSLLQDELPLKLNVAGGLFERMTDCAIALEEIHFRSFMRSIQD